MPIVYATTALREAVKNLLAVDPGFQSLEAALHARQRGQLLSQLAEAIAKLKLAVVVNAAEVVEANPETDPPVLKVRITLTVTETKLNKGHEVEEVAEYLLRFLHGKAVPVMGEAVTLYIDGRPWSTAEAPGVSLVNVSFQCVGLPAQRL